MTELVSFVSSYGHARSDLGMWKSMPRLIREAPTYNDQTKFEKQCTRSQLT